MMLDIDIDILKFIKSCIQSRKIKWTYHINMRLEERHISREAILSSIDTYEIIEEYPEDKYLPSYLIYAKFEELIIHILIAVDIEGDSVTIVTAYKPTLDKWEADFKMRRRP